MTDIEVKGLAELQKLLDELPARIEANVVRGGLRAAAKVIRDEARRLCPVGDAITTFADYIKNRLETEVKK